MHDKPRSPKVPLKPEEMFRCCEFETLDFETTRDITPVSGTIGQERATRSLDFGLSLDAKGFNIFILGEGGTGKMTTIRELIKKLAADRPVPPDWCYVYNFKAPDMPHAISLPAGRALKLQREMKEFVDFLQVEITKIFETKEYEKSRSAVVEEFQIQQKKLFSSLEEEAKPQGFSIRKNVSGLVIVPIKEDGEPLTEDEFEKLDDEHKSRVETLGKGLQEQLDDIVRSVRSAEKGLKKQLDDLERNAVFSLVDHYVEELKENYKVHEKVLLYLDQVKEDVLENLADFKNVEEQPNPLPFMKPPQAEPNLIRYQVNVVVNNSDTKGAPCVFESNPSYTNLSGRIEYKFLYGMSMTDFSMIKGGAMHRANGGYLVIDALDLLRNVFSYEALKRAIRNREVKIEDMWEQYRLGSSSTLKPEPIPLDVKVILIGNPQLYYMLYNLDEEYRELFKVKADFESRMSRNDESILKYAEFISAKCNEENLRHFDRTGVSRVIEYGSRLAGEQGKLSSKFSDVADLVREAAYWAGKNGSDIVGSQHVEQAVRERVYRNSRIDDRMREAMLDDTIIVATEGERVGQVNGLAVLSMGDYSFGKPSRITAQTFVGRSGLVNIERETKMSGRIHDKAILIITGYLGSKYAHSRPISLSASLTFEQLYEMIDGDSATCAELYAILSSLSGVPLRQDMAVTGSMDQNGEVQPIGGVNEKIEGFFDLLKDRGLKGTEGVIIPRRNVRHLMLKQEVVDAVTEGKFFIYPIDFMEEGLEILTGREVGVLQADGTYPEGSINALVMKRFDDIEAALKRSTTEKKKDEDEDGKDKSEGSPAIPPAVPDIPATPTDPNGPEVPESPGASDDPESTSADADCKKSDR